MDNGQPDTDSNGLDWEKVFQEIGGKKAMLIQRILKQTDEGVYTILKLNPHQLHFVIEIGLGALLSSGSAIFRESKELDEEFEKAKEAVTEDFLMKTDKKDMFNA